MEGDRLSDLNAGSGAQNNVLVKTLRCFDYEVMGKSQKFTVQATMVVDCDANMTHLVEHFFGPVRRSCCRSVRVLASEWEADCMASQADAQSSGVQLWPHGCKRKQRHPGGEFPYRNPQ